GSRRLAHRSRGNPGMTKYVHPADPIVRVSPSVMARVRHCAPRRQRGFSLLEVLVAFVIVSLVAVALFGMFGGALRNGSSAEEWTRALLVAESRLATASTVTPLRESTEQGSEADGRIRWQTEVKAYAPPDPNQDLERASETM